MENKNSISTVSFDQLPPHLQEMVKSTTPDQSNTVENNPSSNFVSFDQLPPHLQEMVNTSPQKEPEFPRAGMINRGIRRATETAIGGTGDLLNIPYKVLKHGYEYATGGESGLPNEIPFLPTSTSTRQRGRELAKEYTGNENYFEPQGNLEEGIDKAIRTTTGLVTGSGSGGLLKSVPLVKAAVMGTGAAIAGQGLKAMGFGKWGQLIGEVLTGVGLGRVIPESFGSTINDATKKGVDKLLNYPISPKDGTPLGSVLSATIDPSGKTLKGYASSLYKSLESSPDYTKDIKTNNFNHSVKNIYDKLKSIGHNTEGDNIVLNELSTAVDKSNAGYLSAENIIKSIQRLNNIYSESVKKGVNAKYLDGLTDLKDKYKDLLSKSNEIGKAFKDRLNEANGIYQGANYSSAVSKFITRNLTKFSKYSDITNILTGAAFPAALTFGSKASIPLLATGIGLKGVSGASNIIGNMLNNPVMLKHYGKLVKSALNNNVPMAIREFKVMDQLTKEKPKK